MTNDKTISWIFLSLALASQTGPADFSSISSIADGIDHAIPTHKELQTSLTWLTNNRLVIKIGNKYSLTDLGKLHYDQSTINNLPLLKMLDTFESVIKKHKK